MQFWKSFIFLAGTRRVFSLSTGGEHQIKPRATTGGGLPKVKDPGCGDGLAHYCFGKGEVLTSSGFVTGVQVYLAFDTSGSSVECKNGYTKTVSCCDQSKFEVLKRAEDTSKGIFISPRSFNAGCPQDK
ncbi:hypothetical protein PGT21_030826 [Puccinia graminis f. sp. tritici]|uniref:Uncharacterized protein n=1 Tax=Puccinia graminis f. sp. tritici TaxID=56615 RepID=A0A5B0Q4T0_PUCGR|nr:hypothetical protein PGT21_029143 [Puccinia graminis f. sp. tritici]KAA1108059.1 hypothetical protein PGTUg99_027179 [Puccinia graminis f. sp. tritici]KAA1113408.1 hypothetical protein PGT21_030826 [Puccinia graminis f. sp. tritici]KAA1122831.1 hypothetical protein PGTUg99_008030 [Puccinia graminis f. sp. tritici]